MDRVTVRTTSRVQREEFFPLKDIYERLGIGERCEWGEFEGVHEIHGVESFAFLDPLAERWSPTESEYRRQE